MSSLVHTSYSGGPVHAKQDRCRGDYRPNTSMLDVNLAILHRYIEAGFL